MVDAPGRSEIGCLKSWALLEDRIADLLQSVENSNPIAREFKSGNALNKNVNERVIKTVRELSDKGWTSDEISRKLLIDENSVRFIINTSSL